MLEDLTFLRIAELIFNCMTLKNLPIAKVHEGAFSV